MPTHIYITVHYSTHTARQHKLLLVWASGNFGEKSMRSMNSQYSEPFSCKSATMFTFVSSIPDLYHPTERNIQYIKIRLLRLIKTNSDYTACHCN